MKHKHMLLLLICAVLFGGCAKTTTQETAGIVPAAATKPPQEQSASTESFEYYQADENIVNETGGRVEAASEESTVVDSGVDGGVEWNLIKKEVGFELRVGGTKIPEGWIKSVPRFTSTDKNGNNSLISRITSVVILDDVTTLGGRAFAGCTALTDVTVGAGVTQMDEQVFMECQSLFSVRFSGTKVPAAALKDNTVVKYVYISSTCTEIGKEAFSGCTALLSVEGASAALVYIQDYAFTKCTSLSGIMDVPGLRLMGMGSFEGCTSIKQIVLPETLISIGAYSFRGCTALYDIQFPQRGDMQIGNNAFENCTSLNRVDLTEAVYSVGDAAFRSCTSLLSISVGGQSSIGADVLAQCTNVTITVTGNLPEEAFKDSAALIKVVFDGNKEIAKGAFSGCTALKTLVFSEEQPVLIIGEEAFFGCAGLVNIELCYGLEEIGTRSFANCAGLETITIPKSLKKIGSAVFSSNPKFIENPRKSIRYAGSEKEWSAVEKPVWETGISWNAGLTRNDREEPIITYLNR